MTLDEIMDIIDKIKKDPHWLSKNKNTKAGMAYSKFMDSSSSEELDKTKEKDNE